MRRRTFIAGLGGAVAWPVAARAQQPGRIRRIGVLASLPLPPLQRFTQKLQQLGYSEDRNLQIEYRFAEGHDDQYPILAEQLVGLPVDLIVTWGTPAALAAKQATAKVPIIMGAVGEAVNTGIVTNLARPGRRRGARFPGGCAMRSAAGASAARGPARQSRIQRR